MCGDASRSLKDRPAKDDAGKKITDEGVGDWNIKVSEIDRFPSTETAENRPSKPLGRDATRSTNQPEDAVGVDRVIYYVVGDAPNSGNGIHVKDLEEMKAHLVNSRPNGKWQLVISIHGAEDLVATVGGNVENPQANGVYEVAALRKLFGDDEVFKEWRGAYGPMWTVLNACQVHQRFEDVILQSFNKLETKQKAQGLGQGCRPETKTWRYDHDDSKTPITTRSQWKQLTKSEQRDLERKLSELNNQFGYFGGPPVEESKLLHYYFDEPPKGGWPVVTVSYNRVDTGIAFYNRTQNARFLADFCTEHLGPMHPHVPKAPPEP